MRNKKDVHVAQRGDKWAVKEEGSQRATLYSSHTVGLPIEDGASGLGLDAPPKAVRLIRTSEQPDSRPRMRTWFAGQGSAAFSYRRSLRAGLPPRPQDAHVSLRN